MHIETIISIFIGGLITWIVALVYYKKAGDQLILESRKLKLTSDLVLYKLQHPNAKTELKRDDSGEIVGLGVFAEAKLKSK